MLDLKGWNSALRSYYMSYILSPSSVVCVTMLAFWSQVNVSPLNQGISEKCLKHGNPCACRGREETTWRPMVVLHFFWKLFIWLGWQWIEVWGMKVTRSFYVWRCEYFINSQDSNAQAGQIWSKKVREGRIRLFCAYLSRSQTDHNRQDSVSAFWKTCRYSNLYWNQDPFLQIDIPKLNSTIIDTLISTLSLAMFTTEKVQASAVPFGS